MTAIVRNTQKKPSHIFIKKAHSLGQSYVCLGLIKPSLWTNIGTCVHVQMRTCTSVSIEKTRLKEFFAMTEEEAEEFETGSNRL